ncbi:MAG: hypothetical protein ACRC7P_09845 [Enterovibrio sp.]
MAIYFVRPSYPAHLKCFDKNVQLMRYKEKRPYLLVDAKISDIKTSVLVPLSKATERRLERSNLYKEIKSPLGVMSTVIRDKDTGDPISLVRHDWAIPYNPDAVKKLNIEDMFDGNYKYELGQILKALRCERTEEPSATMKEIELNTQLAIDNLQKLKKESHYEACPDIVKQSRGAKNYKVPEAEEFVALLLKAVEDKDADSVPLAKEQTPLFFREVDERFSFSQAVKNEEPPFSNESDLQQSTMSYAGAVKKTPLAAEHKQAAGVADEQQNDEAGTAASSSNLSGSVDVIPPATRKTRRKLPTVKLTNLTEKTVKKSEQTFAQAASSQPSQLTFKGAPPKK